ncbi:alcohol dehydrogenase catalytic domain-containing protein [Paenibacillus sp. AR247]|uniref:alcohol dehydrogenase catalytic domain-containing protein n=1 Tax=Paenibacillus sp. AR247 TaxID=1631599 RepID=UPI002157BA56|nr:alcohol dehydrogenase catalytic domain-containing protein [Paenibacillus sp. AR247]
MENLDTSSKDVNNQTSSPATMRAIRLHDYGEPADVLRMEQVEIPSPGPGRIRVTVRACGLNPVDWVLCKGLYPGKLPRGIGLEVSGIVEAVGEGSPMSLSVTPSWAPPTLSAPQAQAQRIGRSWTIGSASLQDSGSCKQRRFQWRSPLHTTTLKHLVLSRATPCWCTEQAQ